MIHIAVTALILLSGNQSVEVTSGFGGIFYKGIQDHPLNSDIMTNLTYKRPWSDKWFYGVGLTLNAYSSDGVLFNSGGVAITDFMVYRRVDMEDLKIVLGAGGGFSSFYSTRYNSGGGEIAQGNYELLNFGVLVGFSISIFKRVAEKLEIGAKINYYAGKYLDRCWEGPEKDCSGIDTAPEHWFIGISLRFILDQD
ncbi:MAG: hypothetical protein JXR95_12145 [Deltaproteobacteria bacterium]|nr:hypothetical protein [Deltaproteobacteria bacterium]